MPQNETELLAQARNGDPAAFEQLAVLYRDRLAGIAASVCATMPSESDDVAQEAMLSAFTHIKAFKANATFGTWLYRIAANKCLDKMRRAKTRATTELTDDFPSADSAETEAAKLSLSRDVNAALAVLPAPYRLAVTLCDIEGLTAPVAAKQLGITVAALKSRLHRARAILKTQLQKLS